MSGIRHLGSTQQRLLRHLLQTPGGAGVESLCSLLRISHNAVRQHITALTTRGLVEQTQSQATGGRPQARYCLTQLGREQFPRNYAQISAALLDGLVERFGQEEAADFLVNLGKRFGSAMASGPPASADDAATELTKKMDELGYEAVRTQSSSGHEIEAFNCVFHALAKHNMNVCKFDLAFMEAASGHRVHHMECIVRGGGVCRFRLGERLEHTPKS